ncbi:MAG: diversity-generating retroelement protein Avd [Chloroflexota bacterium]
MTEEMVIFTRTYDFISWLLPLVEKFPKSQRFMITARLQNAALDFQELLIEANAHRGANRLEKLQSADAELLKTRLYLRLCEKWKWLTPGQFRHASAMVSELGKLLGGWMKTVASGS